MLPSMRIDQHDQRRRSFDRDAAGYDQARPGYPDAIYDLLATRCGLRAGSRLLEIGAGSGTATTELLVRGANVTAVEPGEAFVELLRQRHADYPLRVLQTDFEHADLPAASFDLAVAATSWHWVDGPVAVPKVARLLGTGGWLAVWWTVFGDPEQPLTPFRAALDRLYTRYLPAERDDGRPPAPLRAEQWTTQLREGGWFGPVSVEMIRWTQTLTPQSARGLWATFPNVAELDPSARAAFLDGVGQAVTDLGGTVDDSRVTAVYYTQKTAHRA